MKQCKACLEMYDLPNPSKYGFFGDHCPKCGTFNSDFNKNSIISFYNIHCNYCHTLFNRYFII